MDPSSTESKCPHLSGYHPLPNSLVRSGYIYLSTYDPSLYYVSLSGSEPDIYRYSLTRFTSKMKREQPNGVA
jgi:hypothetical protein